MLLKEVKVGPFRSINEPQTVDIDEKVTVLVGMNEAGKTVFLKALEKANDALGLAQFVPVDDYPRKELSGYLKTHKTSPAQVAILTFSLSKKELDEINKSFHIKLTDKFTASLNYSYNNKSTVTIDIDDAPAIKVAANGLNLSAEAKAAIGKVKSFKEIPAELKNISLTDADKAFVKDIETRIGKMTAGWTNLIEFEVWQSLSRRVPRFLYFSDYDLLPSKTSLQDLAQRVEQSKADPTRLKPQHRAVLALLRMADISINDFMGGDGYEPLKAKIEAVSIKLTDEILAFWKQNEDLEVEVDIKPDPTDEVPFNAGPNLYLRIKNRRHRGVSTPFAQRSRGFIWFFSFLVWFDSVQHQIGSSAISNLVLLLDEPGLALHALAQRDFLKYIDSLSERHQVLYTTHSPFMVNSDRLNQVRIVEDKDKVGTVISANLMGSDPRTIFPLQAALGWTIAQNLFISPQNILVEGPADLIYLKMLAGILEANGMVGLRNDITIVPVGGLDKVVTFVALLGANSLKLVVFHDYDGAPEQKLDDLVREKLIPRKAILNAAQFRDLSKLGTAQVATDLEDLFDPAFYVQQFNQTFAKSLPKPIDVKGLPAGNRIIQRLQHFLLENKIQLRPSGGFNHYLMASHIASNPPASLDKDTLNRFEELFKAINGLF